MTSIKLFKNKVILLVILFILFNSYSAFTQENVKHARNTIFIEMSTGKPIYSINYDRIIFLGDKSIYSSRVGIYLTKNEVSFPLGLNMITGKRANHLEFSLVLAPYFIGHRSFPTSIENSDTYVLIKPALDIDATSSIPLHFLE